MDDDDVKHVDPGPNRAARRLLERRARHARKRAKTDDR